MPRTKTKEPLKEDQLNNVLTGFEEFMETPINRWYLHTGNLALDYIISMKVDGTGGYPGGCITELFGEPSCLVADTKVALSNGALIKIEELGKKHLEKIDIDIMVDGKFLNAPAKVFHKYNNQQVVELELEDGRKLIGTPNHPLLQFTREHESLWTRLDQLKVGDQVYVVNKIPCSIDHLYPTGYEYKKRSKYAQSYKYKIPQFVNENLASIYGYLLGDGWIRKNLRGVGFVFNETETDLIPRMLKYVDEEFGIPPFIQKRKSKSGTIKGKTFIGKQILTYVEYFSVPMAQMLFILKNKRIPDSIFKSRNTVTSAFLSWLFEADGHVNTGKERGMYGIGFTSVHRQLLEDIQLLLLRFGIRSHINNTKLTIRNMGEINKFAKYIGFQSNKKQTRLDTLINNRKNLRSKYILPYLSIKSIKHPHQLADVFDIEIPKWNQFIANGIVSHNTGKSLLLAKALSEAQKVGMIAVVADAEGRWDDDFASLQGVDLTKRIRTQPITVEEFAIDAHNILEKAKEQSKRVAMVLDSLAILSTLKETEDIAEGDLKMDQGRKAQRIRQAIRVLRSDIRNSGSILLISNHVIANPGAYIATKITPGGGGVPFQSSVRVELTHPTKLVQEGKDRPIGVELHTQVTKNSIAPPFGKCNMRLYWGSGVDKYSGLASIMKDLGIVTLEGAWYNYKGDKFHAEDLNKFVEKHPEIMTESAWIKPYFTERS